MIESKCLQLLWTISACFFLFFFHLYRYFSIAGDVRSLKYLSYRYKKECIKKSLVKKTKLVLNSVNLVFWNENYF